MTAAGWLITSQYQAGTTSRATLAQAQLQLENGSASAQDYQWQRAQMEHANALLVGKTTVDFGLAAALLTELLTELLTATLPAMQEVEDKLVELNTLQGEIAVQPRATATAQVTPLQYESGMITYLDVATTENSSLSAQQGLLTLQNTQSVRSVALIAALGGGCQAP